MLKQTSHNTDYNLELLAAKELKKFDNGKYIFGDPAAVPIEEIIENHYGITSMSVYSCFSLSYMGTCPPSNIICPRVLIFFLKQ